MGRGIFWLSGRACEEERSGCSGVLSLKILDSRFRGNDIHTAAGMRGGTMPCGSYNSEKEA
jgi:hypothetical protein